MQYKEKVPFVLQKSYVYRRRGGELNILSIVINNNFVHSSFTLISLNVVWNFSSLLSQVATKKKVKLPFIILIPIERIILKDLPSNNA